MFIYICVKHNTFTHLLREDNISTRLFFVPNSHHVWLWDISLPSISCSLSQTFTMYDYGIFRYRLYLVLRFISFVFPYNIFFLSGHDVNISLILFTLGFAFRILHLSAVPRLYLFVVVEYAWAFSTMSQELL